MFQINANLPFLYPVDIKSSGYFPQTQFNQYLSNYHNGKVGLYDATANKMHSLFFGGMSQYYYNGTTLIQDDNVPFVKTISRVTRIADGTLKEHKFPLEMPTYKGAGTEFIPNASLPHYTNKVIKLNDITATEFVIGHLYGGIQSPSTNPFSTNQTSTTSADPTIYEVKLIYTPTLDVPIVNGKNPFTMSVSPNPTKNGVIRLNFTLAYETSVDYFVTSMDGKILSEGEITDAEVGTNAMNFELNKISNQVISITFIFDNKFYVSQKVVVN